jgi:hypothetical protein
MTKPVVVNSSLETTNSHQPLVSQSQKEKHITAKQNYENTLEGVTETKIKIEIEIFNLSDCFLHGLGKTNIPLVLDPPGARPRTKLTGKKLYDGRCRSQVQSRYYHLTCNERCQNCFAAERLIYRHPLTD